MSFVTREACPVCSGDEIPSGRFDLINVDQVLEHLTHPAETLEHLSRALVADGIIRITVPNGSGLPERIVRDGWLHTAGTSNAVAPLEHLNCFTRRSLRALGRRAGLEEYRLPLRARYSYQADWSSPGRILRNLFGPVYRAAVPRETLILFTPAATGGNRGVA